MRTRSLSQLTRLLVLCGLAGSFTGCLTGCYTQLYTRGYAERILDSDRGYAYRPRPAADTLRPSSTTLQAGQYPPGQVPDGQGPDGQNPDGQSPGADSALAAGTDSGRGAEDGERSSTVIVNNYYPDRTYYRGYSTLDWDYPFISFGFYSSRYRDYGDPYWWHEGGRGYGHGHGYDRGYHGSVPGGGGGNGANHSNPRLFTPAPAYPELRKGRRTQEPQAQPAPAQPAPKTDANSGTSSQESHDRNSSGSSSSQSEEKHESHPALQKGRR